MDDKRTADVAAQTIEAGPLTGLRTRQRTGAGRPAAPPSKPWFGGVILACLTLAAVWVLTYTLAPLPGQRALGGWNYAVVGLLLTGFVGLSRAWHGEPPQRPKKP